MDSAKETGVHANDEDLTRMSRWVALGVFVVVIGMVPWTGYLAVTLPGHFRSHNWNVAWVGFDAALMAVLAFNAWAVWTKRQILAGSAIVAATMLVCDAWFDVNTSFGTRGEVVTIVTAVFGNLPMAAFLVWMARGVMRRTVAAFVGGTTGTEPPRHLRDAPLLFSSPDPTGGGPRGDAAAGGPAGGDEAGGPAGGDEAGGPAGEPL
jgi:hypothetical protein